MCILFVTPKKADLRIQSKINDDIADNVYKSLITYEEKMMCKAKEGQLICD